MEIKVRVASPHALYEPCWFVSPYAGFVNCAQRNANHDSDASSMIPKSCLCVPDVLS